MSVDESKLKALVSLLADEDIEVANIAKSEILKLGSPVLDLLEDFFLFIENNDQKNRLEEIIAHIRTSKIKEELAQWLVSPEQDLFDGWCIVSQLSGREVKKESIYKELEQIKVSVWLGLQPDQSELEKIKYMNHILFYKYGFVGDDKDYSHPSNSFIDTVLSNKKGNPISLASLYIVLAQKLKLPVFGVNLPQHFVLAFMPIQLEKLNDEDIDGIVNGEDVDIPVDKDDQPLFYINPFGKGGVFGKQHLFNFLKELKLPYKEKFTRVCDSRAIVKRMLRNLQLSFAKMNKLNKKKEVDDLLRLFENET